jgi:hypothetical protein
MVPEQRRQTSPAHARIIPKSCSKRSCAIEGAVAPAVNVTATANPVLSRDFAALFQPNRTSNPFPVCVEGSVLCYEVAGALAHVHVSKTAKIR